VGEDDSLGAGAPAVVSRLLRSQMAAHTVALGSRQRRLDQQHVGVAGEADELLVGAAVGAEGQPPALAGELHRVRGSEVRDLAEADRERTDLKLVGDGVFRQREGVLDQVRVAPAADELTEHRPCAAGRAQARASRVAGPRPPGDGNRLLARGIRERVTERDEVEDVVGVQVADQDGVDVDVVTEAPQLREHPVAAVEQQREVPVLHQVAAAGATRVLPGR